MASFAQSLLDDLRDLDDENEEEDAAEGAPAGAEPSAAKGASELVESLSAVAARRDPSSAARSRKRIRNEGEGEEEDNDSVGDDDEADADADEGDGEDEDDEGEDDEEEDDEEEDDEEEEDGDLDGEGDGSDSADASKSSPRPPAIVLAPGTTLRDVARIRSTTRFQAHLAAVRAALERPVEVTTGPLEDHPDYPHIVASTDILLDVEDEILHVHRFVADLYAKKFPELPTLIPNPLDFVRLVRVIGNETDLTLVDLASVLTPQQIMIVSVTGSTTSGKPLAPADLAAVLAGCEEVLALEEARVTVLRFLETRMRVVAPNVTALLDTSLAARLLGLAGGIVALSKIPACNIQVMGKVKKTSATGLSRATQEPHAGLVFQSRLVRAAPPHLRTKTAKVVAAKVALAARVDSCRQAADGAVGLQYVAFVEAKVAKWQEPPPAKKRKALPAPDDKPKKHRGGRRKRKMKEKYGLTEVRKQINRVSFGVGEGDYSESVMGLDRGRFTSAAGSGALRMVKKEQKNLLKVRKDVLAQQEKAKRLMLAAAARAGGGGGGGGGAATGGGRGLSTGHMSTITFTPVQGMELVNPDAAKERVRLANERYFGTASSRDK